MASTGALTASNLFSVKGYVCVVTGGGSGIGLMAAQALAANGAKVYITGRRLEALQKAADAHNPDYHSGGRIIPAGPCDVTSKEDLENLVGEISHKEEYIDLLVTNAGISGPKAPPDTPNASDLRSKLWTQESFQDWNEVFNTNVSAVYFTTVAFLPLLQAAPKSSSSVIVISSMSGLMRHAQGHFSYNTAKAGTAHLSKLMSKEFQKTGIRVNSIAPGYFPSEMTMGESDDRQKTHMPDEKAQEKGHVPAGRPGRDEEMAMLVLFFAKNGYINGEVVAIDGGVLNEVAGR